MFIFIRSIIKRIRERCRGITTILGYLIVLFFVIGMEEAISILSYCLIKLFIGNGKKGM